jgi:hypothetical protein
VIKRQVTAPDLVEPGKRIADGARRKVARRAHDHAITFMTAITKHRSNLALGSSQNLVKSVELSEREIQLSSASPAIYAACGTRLHSALMVQHRRRLLPTYRAACGRHSPTLKVRIRAINAARDMQ